MKNSELLHWREQNPATTAASTASHCGLSDESGTGIENESTIAVDEGRGRFVDDERSAS